MAELGDLKLDKPYEPPPDERRLGWRVLLVVLLVVAVGYLVWSLVRKPGQPAPDVKVQTEQQKADAEKLLTPEPGEDIDLPELRQLWLGAMNWTVQWHNSDNHGSPADVAERFWQILSPGTFVRHPPTHLLGETT